MDESRDEENVLYVARTMLPAERYAGNGARVTRKISNATKSLVSSSARRDLAPSDPDLIWRSRTKSIRCLSSSATSTSDEAVPSFARDGSAWVALVAEENKSRGDPGSDDYPRPTQSLSVTML